MDTNDTFVNLDIDECEERPNACNLAVSNCTNTFGSYECQCLEEESANDKDKHTCSQNVSDPKTSWIFKNICDVLLIRLIFYLMPQDGI